MDPLKFTYLDMNGRINSRHGENGTDSVVFARQTQNRTDYFCLHNSNPEVLVPIEGMQALQACIVIDPGMNIGSLIGGVNGNTLVGVTVALTARPQRGMVSPVEHDCRNPPSKRAATAFEEFQRTMGCMGSRQSVWVMLNWKVPPGFPGIVYIQRWRCLIDSIDVDRLWDMLCVGCPRGHFAIGADNPFVCRLFNRLVQGNDSLVEPARTEFKNRWCELHQELNCSSKMLCMVKDCLSMRVHNGDTLSPSECDLQELLAQLHEANVDQLTCLTRSLCPGQPPRWNPYHN